MPTYDYFCSNCNHTMEVSQKISDEALQTCPNCKKDTIKRGPGGGIGTIFGSSSKENPMKSPGSCGCGKRKGSCH